ncbi:MAG: cytochrome C [Nitrospira sp. WS110]|nr:cytochrome C [Nitrospira sp. WS110]
MKQRMISIALLALVAVPLIGAMMSKGNQPFAPNVDMMTGAIRVPENYAEWPTLGTWAHAHTDDKLEKMGPGVHEYHVVYTQPETITHYRQHRRFPDGAVLVKELLDAKTMAMTTGPAVGHATTIKGWFVLVRDTEGRFKDSKLWGDGWAWSLFNADDPKHSISKDYKTECVPCHLPARQLAPEEAVDADKWIYSFGYSVLQKQ